MSEASFLLRQSIPGYAQHLRYISALSPRLWSSLPAFDPAPVFPESGPQRQPNEDDEWNRRLDKPFLLPDSLLKVPPGRPEMYAPAADILPAEDPVPSLPSDTFSEWFLTEVSTMRSLPCDVSAPLILCGSAPSGSSMPPAAVPHLSRPPVLLWLFSAIL